MLQTIADRRDLNLVEFPGAFLAVTGNEGDGRAFLEQDGGGGDLTGLEAEFLGNLDEMFFDHRKRCFRLKAVGLLGNGERGG